LLDAWISADVYAIFDRLYEEYEVSGETQADMLRLLED